jgi:hypothetical protein
LAKAANDFLGALFRSAAPEVNLGIIPGGVEDVEEELLLETNIWVTDMGLPEGEISYELTAEETGDVIAILDLAWPDGLQTGLSEPVALLIDENVETLELANAAGFHYFSNVEDFTVYVRVKILAMEPI